MLDISIFILIFVVVIELWIKPRLDKTSEGKYLIWYGRRNRKYIILNPD